MLAGDLVELVRGCLKEPRQQRAVDAMKRACTLPLDFRGAENLSWTYTGKEDDPYMKSSDGSCSAKREVTEA